MDEPDASPCTCIEEKELTVKISSGSTARMLDDRTIEVNLPSKMGYERIAMDFSACFARILGFDPERIEDLRTAVSEASLNAMEHGNRWDSNRRVVVTINYDEESLTVFVVDEGRGMAQLPDERQVREKIAQLQPTRGLGIFLIRRLVDHVEFNRLTDQGHAVKMVITMAGARS
ncbi:MAG: ATP-binding protein [Deltaproteobacteria bacterium]|nr:ATP-binding protein [Deltaproteobacteria bacterium]